ncbi:MAG: tetratricopeptide repeat protein, partial [Bacteroidetes bacterium]
PAPAPATPTGNDGFFKIAPACATDARNATPAQVVPIQEAVASRFLPEPVLHFNAQGEFRRVVSVFISFAGVSDHASLDAFARHLLEQAANFSGYLKEIDFGDKGGVIPVFFGAPVSFENNVERALEFVLSVENALTPMQESGGLRFRAGITSGIAYTGLVGGRERCQYAAVGNRVNIAARLMTKAGWGEIWVDEEVQKSRFFRFKHQGDLSYKGLKAPIPTYQLVGRSVNRHNHFEGEMVGRDRELKTLYDFCTAAFDVRLLRVAYVFGEAGIGKTRLSFELRKALRERGKVAWFTCQADQILRKPFNPFIYFLKDYFEQSPENSTKDNLINFKKRFQWLVQDSRHIDHPKAPQIRRELLRTQSILAALIGLNLPDSIWETLDARGRYDNTFAALTNLFLAEALIQPTIIELEDGHWFDEDSKKLVNGLLVELRTTPTCFLVTSRYDDNGNKPYLFDRQILAQKQIETLEIDLNILSPEALRAFAQKRLGAPIDKDLYDLLLRTTNGNPFYAEQILEYFLESDLLCQINGAWTIKDKNVKISTSINAVLTARIDRLSTLVKETVKAAAVIGREFELPVLTEVMKTQPHFIEENGNMSHVLNEQIKTAERGQIWQAMNELRYIFKHSLLREAVYDMQLRARLRELHRLIGEAIERVYRDNLPERYVDLVFHFEQAGETEKLIAYLRKAAEYARRNFQNQQALGFLEKLETLLAERNETVSLIQTLLRKGEILELIGQWEAAQTAFEKALERARKTDDRALIGYANNGLGHLLLLKGNYPDAGMYLEAAAAFFESIGHQEGISVVYGNLGNLYFRQGNYEDAKSHFVRSLEIAQSLKNHPVNAQIVANLGLTYMNLGKYDEGIAWQQSQLDICKQNRDKPGMAALYTNMGIVYFEKGDYDAALRCYEKGLELSEELGNKLLTSIAIGCLGSVFQQKGDYEKAMTHFQKDLELAKEMGDKQGISIALGLIGELLSVKGEFEQAIQYLTETLAISEELGYQKGIAKALNTLGDVYFYKNEFDTSIQYYDRAIEVTRDIGNKLVLGMSLVEKGAGLVATQQFDKARQAVEEALQIAQNIGNPDLLFEARLLHATVLARDGDPDTAKNILTGLLEQATGKKERADLLFALFELTGNPDFRQSARDLYRELFAEMPKFAFKKRLEILEGKT